MKKYLTKKHLLIFCVVLLTIAILVIYNDAIIDWLSQCETLRTLLTNASFWNENVNHWLGDMLTFIGVMLAFSLPFSAQVVQWVVSTYGVASFPNLVDKKLSIQSILPQMFVFVTVVIFWRLFRYDLSPNTPILYLMVNLILAFSFIYLSWRLFYIAKLIIQYTFNFENTVIKAAFNNIYSVAGKSQTNTPALTDEYLDQVALLRDYELAEYQKGNIHQEYSDFTQYVWNYIRSLFATNQPERINQAIKLQERLSLSIKKMCVIYAQSNTQQYRKLAVELTQYTVANAYYFFEKEIRDKKTTTPPQENESDYFSDIRYLACEIETKNNNNNFSILSGSYLNNYVRRCYLLDLSLENITNKDWRTMFEAIDQLDNEIIELTRELINISESHNLSKPPKKIYENIKKDTKCINEIDIRQYLRNTGDLDIYNKFITAKNEQNIHEILEIFFPLQVDKNTTFPAKQKKKIFDEILNLNYQFKIENLIIFWLGKISFNSSILIEFLEEATPIDLPKILGPKQGHLIPQSLTEVFHSFFKIPSFDKWDEVEDRENKKPQITYSTMTFYLLIREYKNHQRAENIAKNTLNDSNFSIKEIRKIRGAAKEWQSSSQGILQDDNLRQLCINHGVDFIEMKDFYLQFLAALDKNVEPAITKRIIDTPLHKDVDNHVKKLETEINSTLQDFKFDRVDKILTPIITPILWEEDKELYIVSDYITKFYTYDIEDPKKYIIDYLKDKSIISNEEALSCKVRYKESDDQMKVIFNVELNFNFKND